MPAKDRREAKAERETSKVVEKSAKQKQQEEVRPARQPRGTSACCSGPLLRLGRCCNTVGTAIACSVQAARVSYDRDATAKLCAQVCLHCSRCYTVLRLIRV
jgi:hypothetical protein